MASTGFDDQRWQLKPAAGPRVAREMLDKKLSTMVVTIDPVSRRRSTDAFPTLTVYLEAKWYQIRRDDLSSWSLQSDNNCAMKYFYVFFYSFKPIKLNKSCFEYLV